MTEQTGTQTINGVDVSELKETVQAVKQTPSLADFRFRIVNKWQGGGLNPDNRESLLRSRAGVSGAGWEVHNASR